MTAYIVRRLMRFVLSLWFVSIVVFFGMRLAPGDPAMLICGEAALPEEIEQARKEYGLDKSLFEQYGIYMSRLFRGDLGRSLLGGVPVSNSLLRAAPASAELALVAWIISTALGLSLGMLAAFRRDSIVDISIVGLAGAGRGLPDFWLAIMLIMIFSVKLRWFPALGRGRVEHLILPAVCISIQTVSLTIRITRDSLLDVLDLDYVRTAWAKGLPQRIVLWKHAVRNAFIPIVTVLGLRIASMLGAGMVITESVFNWPGLGYLLVKAVQWQDYPTVQGCMLLIGAIFLLINLFVDILYSLIDPRISYN